MHKRSIPCSIVISSLLLATSLPSVVASECVYSIVSHLNVREQPNTQSRILVRLARGRWVDVKEKQAHWTEVYLDSGISGFVWNEFVSDVWIKVWKQERRLLLMSGDDALRTYSIALGFNPDGDKEKRGDGCTPIGRFCICEMLHDPQPRGRYGARSMRISYPNLEDARRGLQDSLISRSEYINIVEKIGRTEKPPQRTALGGSIRIHGGGIGSDWTLGCIAMNDSDITELYSLILARNTLVEIYTGKENDVAINSSSYINNCVLETAKQLMQKGCTYTNEATGIFKIDYPMGDFDPQIGVCTDVIIRSLRPVGIDLQALLYEDIYLHPERYPAISRANTDIDHRRTRNLKIWFDHHAVKRSNAVPAEVPQEWLPGDIVILDTGIQNGTIYDHIGIVSNTKTDGRPLVINLWTVGSTINEMDLLTGSYPTIVGHYRLKHPLYYSFSC